MDKNLIKQCLREIMAEDEAAAGKVTTPVDTKKDSVEKETLKKSLKLELSKTKLSRIAGTVETDEMIITLKLLCDKLGIDEKAARKALRDSNISHEGHTWVWKGKVPEAVLTVLVTLIA
jgi:ribosomal protein S25